jgi:hypothetical protein
VTGNLPQVKLSHSAAGRWKRINVMKKFVGYTLRLGTHGYHLFEDFTHSPAVVLYCFSRVSFQELFEVIVEPRFFMDLTPVGIG